ncbi:MAG: methyltransferase, partial [Oscillospiraceae bacterium]|nr:methyltransferase [Oscillospiraceae bacterium]
TDSFETQIRFPKKKQTALELEDILHRFDKQVIEGYGLEITDDEIWITERVNNLLFQKLQRV